MIFETGESYLMLTLCSNSLLFRLRRGQLSDYFWPRSLVSVSARPPIRGSYEHSCVDSADTNKADLHVLHRRRLSTTRRVVSGMQGVASSSPPRVLFKSLKLQRSLLIKVTLGLVKLTQITN